MFTVRSKVGRPSLIFLEHSSRLLEYIKAKRTRPNRSHLITCALVLTTGGCWSHGFVSCTLDCLVDGLRV